MHCNNGTEDETFAPRTTVDAVEGLDEKVREIVEKSPAHNKVDAENIVVGNYTDFMPFLPMTLYNRSASNRLAYIPPECIVWEQTTDGGVTWTAKTVSDKDKQKIFLDGADDAFIFPKNNGVPTPDCGLRLNISLYRYNYPTAVTDADKMQYWTKELRTSNSHLYCRLQYFYFNSASSSGINVTLEGRKNETFSELASGTVRGWSGVGLLSTNEPATCGGSKTANYYDILRFTFFLNPNEKNANARLYNIHGFGDQIFLGNQQATNGVPYALLPDKKTSFHGDVYALSFNGHQLNKDVPADAKFTDTTYAPASQDANGLMSAKDKKKLDGIAQIIQDAITAAAPMIKLQTLQQLYPINSIYTSLNETEPSAVLGFGTWERIKGRFLFGADETYQAWSVGGELTHTLTVNELPSHDHPQKGVHPGVSTSGQLGTYSVRIEADKKPNWDANRTSKTGGGKPFDKMPPYIAVFIWRRTA